MKSVRFVFLLAACALMHVSVLAQTQSSGTLSQATVSPPEVHRSGGRVQIDDRRSSFSFERASTVSGRLSDHNNWDISYGMIIGWFVVGLGIEGDRSSITDLGKHDWSDNLRVPKLAPVTELKPGEVRYITTSISKPTKSLPADVRGAPSARDEMAPPERDPDNWPKTSPPVSMFGNAKQAETSMLFGPPNAKKSKPAPVLAPVSQDHMYLIHVFKETRDYYVLLRVDDLDVIGNCTFTWKRVPAP